MRLRGWTIGAAGALICAAANAQSGPNERTGAPAGTQERSPTSNDDSVSQAAKPVLPPDAARPRQDGRNPEQAERIRSNANGQARKAGARGNLERKADAPAQMNRHPKPMGSGAPSIPVDEQPPVRGKNYGRASSRGRAGGVASDKDNPSGAATEGSAGKSDRTQPPDPGHR